MNSDTKQRYGTISRWLHWGMGFLIVWQLLKIFDRISDGEHWVGETLVPWHVSIGTLLLLLAVLRIVWAVIKRHERPDVVDPGVAGKLAKAGHGLLYLAMLLMPVTGISILIGGGYGLTAFGVELIAGGDEIPWLSSFGGTLHSPVAWLLLIMIIGHAGMAFVHHFAKKDGVLQRML